MGLYIDNGLIIIRNPNGAKLDSYRKKIFNALKMLGFKTTIHTNLKTVNYLDVTLNLANCTYEPNKKHNDTSFYILNLQNTHPQLPNKSPNPLDVHYPETPPTSIFLTNTHTHIRRSIKTQQELKFKPPKEKSKHRSRNIIRF